MNAPVNMTVLEREEIEQTFSPPAETAGEGMAMLDAFRDEEMARMEAEVKARIEASNQDPTQQSYFFRMDKKAVIRDEKEYMECVEKKIAIKIVDYKHAVHLIKEEEARGRNKAKLKQKKKVAKSSRKRNR